MIPIIARLNVHFGEAIIRVGMTLMKTLKKAIH